MSGRPCGTGRVCSHGLLAPSAGLTRDHRRVVHARSAQPVAHAGPGCPGPAVRRRADRPHAADAARRRACADAAHRIAPEALGIDLHGHEAADYSPSRRRKAPGGATQAARERVRRPKPVAVTQFVTHAYPAPEDAAELAHADADVEDDPGDTTATAFTAATEPSPAESDAHEARPSRERSTDACGLGSQAGRSAYRARYVDGPA